jgi:hypothetical protein
VVSFEDGGDGSDGGEAGSKEGVVEEEAVDFAGSPVELVSQSKDAMFEVGAGSGG